MRPALEFVEKSSWGTKTQPRNKPRNQDANVAMVGRVSASVMVSGESQAASSAALSGSWLRSGQVEPLRYLYHYTTATRAAEILDSEELWLGPYSKTNDPRESKEWVPKISWVSDSLPTGRLLDQTYAVQQDTDRLLRRGARLGCFGLDRDPASGAEGFLFHRGWARARMWDQYAGKHTGACLVFDLASLVERADGDAPHGNGDFFTTGRVVYEDRPLSLRVDFDRVRQEGLEAVLSEKQMGRNMGGRLYLTKNRDWESEQEFRIVVVRWNVPETEEPKPLKVRYGTALRAVVLGEHFPSSERSVIHHRRAARTIEIVSCRWVMGDPLLDP